MIREIIICKYRASSLGTHRINSDILILFRYKIGKNIKEQKRTNFSTTTYDNQQIQMINDQICVSN